MKKFYLLLLICFITSYCLSQCPCGELNGEHIRQDAKDRSIPSSISNTEAVTVTQVINDWAIPSTTFQRDPEGTFPREQSLVKLTGFLKLIKKSSDDCDYHLEIAADESDNSPRIIAEIPNTSEYCKIRTKLLNALSEIFNVSVTSKHEFKSNTGEVPSVTITGFPFFDTAHWSKKHINNKKGSSHGSAKVATLWEIHPIVKIEVE